MKKFEKVFVIEGNNDDYVVRFNGDGKEIHAHCTCQAGEFKMLCKHVLGCIEADDEIADAFRDYGLMAVYEEYMQKDQEAEKIKREAKNLKKKLARILLR